MFLRLKESSQWSLFLGFVVIVILSECVTTLQGMSYLEDVTLTSEQKAILDKFKDRMIPRVTQDYMKEDIYLIRWLRDKDFNLRDAEIALQNHIKWRKEFRMDTILEEDWTQYERDYKFWLEGRDKEGKPLLYFEAGSHDIRKAVLQGRTQQYLRYVYKSYEELSLLVRDLGNKYQNVTRAQMMINLNGYNLVQHGCLQCIPVLLRVIISNIEHYPGTLDKLILINTPSTIGPLLEASRQIVQPNSKFFKVYGTNKKEWQSAISEIFDWNQLPLSIGGTKVYSGMEE